MKRAAELALCVLAAVSIGVAWQSLKFVSGNPAHFSPEFQSKYLAMLPVVIVHGAAAIAALVLGPPQFVPALRARFPRVHRYAGRFYVVAVVLGGITGFRMGLEAHGGALAAVAFCTMGLLWIATGLLAWKTAVERRFAAHRAWMVRNFALTFGAVTLRIYLNGLQHLGYDFDAIYVPVAWAAWVPNLIVAEGIVRGWFQWPMGNSISTGVATAGK